MVKSQIWTLASNPKNCAHFLYIPNKQEKKTSKFHKYLWGKAQNKKKLTKLQKYEKFEF
jgi:hypothetical protein